MGGDAEGGRVAPGVGALSPSHLMADDPVIRVVPDIPGLAKQFDYTLPVSLRDSVAVGTRVRIVLHGRRVGGWVVAIGVDPPHGVELRGIDGVAGCGPPPELIEVAEWAAWRWAGPLTTFLRAASPERRVPRLPTPPVVTGPEGERRSGAGEAPVGGGASLLRLAPSSDPLPVVLEVVDAARRGARPGTVLVMVPSRGWAERMAGRLRRRGVPVAQGWSEAAAGWPVVVGVRAAAWTPAPRLAAAIVLDAHDEAYQEERAPTWVAWAVAVERARRDGAPCVLVSPCPTAELVHQFPVSTGDRSVERAGWPRVVVADRRLDDPRTGLLSDALVDLVRRSVDLGRGPVVCVLNRRGRARLLACASCGVLARCTRCGWPAETRSTTDEARVKGSPATRPGDELACRRCASVRPVVCAACGSGRFKVLRPGVSKVREDLEALLGRQVVEVTGAAPSDVGEDRVSEGGVVIGTEAVLHRVRRAAAVAFLDFDQHLLAPRFGAAEDALALVVRAGRMVGGRGQEGSGVVLVQTRIPEHAVITAAVHGDPGPLVAEELALRRQLLLPPFAALALVSGPTAEEYCRRVVGGDRVSAGPVSAGPVSAVPMGGDRWLIRAPDHQVLCDRLASSPRTEGRLRVALEPRDV